MRFLANHCWKHFPFPRSGFELFSAQVSIHDCALIIPNMKSVFRYSSIRVTRLRTQPLSLSLNILMIIWNNWRSCACLYSPYWHGLTILVTLQLKKLKMPQNLQSILKCIFSKKIKKLYAPLFTIHQITLQKLLVNSGLHY